MIVPNAPAYEDIPVPPLVSLLSLSQESGAAQLQGAVLTAADIEVVNCLQVYTCSLTAYRD